MKVFYDNISDSAYIKMSDLQPEGVIEISDWINIDVTVDNQLVGIEVLTASKKFPLSSLFSFEQDEEILEKLMSISTLQG